jgi:hypothetical protein
MMLRLGKSKARLPFLEPPKAFGLTVADIPLDGTIDDHIRAVRAWAADVWATWHPHHEFIRAWTMAALDHR